MGKARQGQTFQHCLKALIFYLKGQMVKLKTGVYAIDGLVAPAVLLVRNKNAF